MNPKRDRQHLLQTIRKEVEGKKKPLWNDDVKKHVENITRHNTLDEVLTLLTTLEEEVSK